MERTKDKWEVRYYHQYGNRRADEEITPDIMCNGERIASVCVYAAAKGKQEIADANAKRICQCVNNFDALLDACKKASYVYDVAISETPTGLRRERLTELNILRMQAIQEAGK